MTNIDASIFKAYDIRGIYPEQINEQIAYQIAQAYCKFINPKTVVVGRDVRLSGPALLEQLKKGLVDSGVNVIDIGTITTDMMYFGVVHTKADGGLMVTASHNPKEYNGIKMVRAKAAPISGDSGMYEIRDIVMSGFSEKTPQAGEVTFVDVFEPYLEKVFSVVDVTKIKPFKVVANLNFGAIGRNVRAVAERLNLDMVWLNDQPDGNFPKGRPDPLIPSNRDETIALIKSSNADFGVAWDADADRCFFLDETGRFLSGYFTTAVLAEYLIKKNGPARILVDSKLNWATEELVKSLGGETDVTRTGHSFYKEKMIKEDALFGGEVSAHYFFKDFYYLDNGLMPFLLIMEMLSQSGKKLSEIYRPYFEKYFAIEETNFKVKSVPEVLAAVKEKYSTGRLSELDGIAVEFDMWRFSVRGSNTEPVIRLNLEARSKEFMEDKCKELSDLINQF
jgi:phosphomannomutase